MSLRHVVVAALILGTAGCGIRAGTPDGGGTSPGGRTVDAEDIAASSARTAWDALQLLGAYLRLEEDKDGDAARMTSRGRASIHLRGEPQVILDGVRIVEYGLLQEMSAGHLERIEFVTGPSATIRYGTNAGSGVIVITTRSAGGGSAAN